MNTLYLAMLLAFPHAAPAFGLPSYTSICNLIGQQVNVSIETEDGEVIEQTMTVGDPADRCPGRCGTGCDGRQIYTQECLEHDLCEHVKGTSYGPCKSLMKRAAYGFAMGTVCQ